MLILGTFLVLTPDCFIYALPFLGLHILYPFAKRVTHHPQLILGFAHSLGVFVSFPALGQSIPFSLDTRYANATGAFSLSAAIVFWTLLNDTIYAAQDIDDDCKAGVGSTMIYWSNAARMVPAGLGSVPAALARCRIVRNKECRLVGWDGVCIAHM